MLWLIDDLVGDGAAGRDVAGEDEERTSLELGTVRPAATSPVEGRGKELRVLGVGGLRVKGAEARRSFFAGVRRGLEEGRGRS
jgi:hypothetical protein